MLEEGANNLGILCSMGCGDSLLSRSIPHSKTHFILHANIILSTIGCPGGTKSVEQYARILADMQSVGTSLPRCATSRVIRQDLCWAFISGAQKRHHDASS